MTARLGATCMALLLALLLGCGGGGGAGGGSSAGGGGSPAGGGGSLPAPTPDFTLTATPASLSLTAGASGTISVLSTASGGFSASPQAQITGLPQGVSAAPVSFALPPGTAQSVVLTAAAGAAPGTFTATITAAAGALSHTAAVSVTVQQQSSGTPAATSATAYVRTNAATEYFAFPNNHWSVYNAPTGRFFSAEPATGQVEVFDAARETEIASIAVPGAYGIGQPADGSALWVGTLLGDVYELDPVKMQVLRRYRQAQIGPFGFAANQALPMADGTIALMYDDNGVDGTQSFAVWDPASNAITIYGQGTGFDPGGTVPTQPLCANFTNIGGFALSADGTGVIVTNVDGGGLCEIFPATGDETSASGQTYSGDIAVSPDGKYLAVPRGPDLQGGNAVALYDQHTLVPAGTFPIPSAAGSSAARLFFSLDSKTLYADSGTGLILAYTIPSGQVQGWAPDLTINDTATGPTAADGPVAGPDFSALDPAGLLAGPAEQGFGFVDVSHLNPGAAGTAFTPGFLTPATGPVGGGTSVHISANATPADTPVSGVYFGAQAASGGGTPAALSATSPAGWPGPVDVRVLTADGGMTLIPEGFSYGPTILSVTPDMATADGGATGYIFGYGFGPSNATAIPAGLMVSVAGAPVTIQDFYPNAYGTMAPPFQLQAIAFQIPPGTPGPADVAVTSSSGATTATGALTYLPAPQLYPLAGAQLAQGVFDPRTGLDYFSDATAIQVFSPAQRQWLAPIPIPGAQRLWGISVSPDGSMLALADYSAANVDIVNLTGGNTVRTLPFHPSALSGGTPHPVGVALSNAGIVYMTAWSEGLSGAPGFFKLDTATGILTSYDVDGPGVTSDAYLRIALSQDGSRVYANDDGQVFSIDTATDAITNATEDPSCCYGDYDLALAPNQTQFAASGYEYDADLNPAAMLTENDYASLSSAFLYGMKFSPDGKLIYQPDEDGLDIFDGRLGQLLHRIALAVPLSTLYDALLSDGQDQNLVAITTQGIAVLDLSTLPEPPGLSYATPALQTTGQRRPALNRTGRHRVPAQEFPVPHVTRAPLASQNDAAGRSWLRVTGGLPRP